MSPDPGCLRPGCGHPESAHDPTVLYCEDCPCTGFLSEEALESEPEEVEELHLGEESA